jgi:hypothetical protein
MTLAFFAITFAVIVAYASRRYWMSFVTEDGRLLVVRCDVVNTPEGASRTCGSGFDQPVLIERSVGTTVVSSLIIRGLEVRRETSQDGVRTVQHRQFADCWIGDPDGGLPEGRSGVGCR